MNFELFQELRRKDYLIIGTISLVEITMLLLPVYLDEPIFSPNTNNFNIATNATILKHSPYYTKSESLEGSKLKVQGHFMELQYVMDTIAVQTKTIIRYRDYHIDKNIIDSLILHSNNNLPILVNDRNLNSFILNMNDF